MRAPHNEAEHLSPMHDRAVAATIAAEPTGWRRPVLFPDAYTWLVFLSAMDVVMTYIILSLGGREVNPIALVVIHTWGFLGASVFKFSLTLVAIVICETVGRMKLDAGRRLSIVMVAIVSIPVVWSFLLLLLATGGAFEVDMNVLAGNFSAG